VQLEFARAHHQILPEKIGCGPGLGDSPKFGGCPLICLQRLKLATLNLICSLSLPMLIIKSHLEEKRVWPWTRGAPQNSEVPLQYLHNRWSWWFQIWYTARDRQGPSQNYTNRKSGCGLGLDELPIILEFPYNISATAEASTFKIGMLLCSLRFAKAHHKILHRKRWTTGSQPYCNVV